MKKEYTFNVKIDVIPCILGLILAFGIFKFVYWFFT